MQRRKRRPRYLADVEVQYSAAAAQAAAAREAVEQQLRVTASALEESRQTPRVRGGPRGRAPDQA